jgi:hypothetical protein
MHKFTRQIIKILKIAAATDTLFDRRNLIVDPDRFERKKVALPPALANILGGGIIGRIRRSLPSPEEMEEEIRTRLASAKTPKDVANLQLARDMHIVVNKLYVPLIDRLRYDFEQRNLVSEDSFLASPFYPAIVVDKYTANYYRTMADAMEAYLKGTASRQLRDLVERISKEDNIKITPELVKKYKDIAAYHDKRYNLGLRLHEQFLRTGGYWNYPETRYVREHENLGKNPVK